MKLRERGKRQKKNITQYHVLDLLVVQVDKQKAKRKQKNKNREKQNNFCFIGRRVFAYARTKIVGIWILKNKRTTKAYTI